MATIGRRTLIAGASIVGLGAAAGVVIYRAGQLGNVRDRNSLAFFDAVTEDYRAGRVVVVGGWILSETEVRSFDPPGTATTSSAPDAT